jgi:hypothetical protein
MACCPGSIFFVIAFHVCLYACDTVMLETQTNHTYGPHCNSYKLTNVAPLRVGVRLRDLLQHLHIRLPCIILIKLSPVPPWHIIYVQPAAFDLTEKWEAKHLPLYYWLFCELICAYLDYTAIHVDGWFVHVWLIGPSSVNVRSSLIDSRFNCVYMASYSNFLCMFVVSMTVSCPLKQTHYVRGSICTVIIDPTTWSFWRFCSKCPSENSVVSCSVPDLRGSEASSVAAKEAPLQGDLIIR